jgi:hypothetical protein
MKLHLAAIILVLFCSQAWADDVVTNGSFEMAPETSERPRYWYVGWSDTPPEYAANGAWAHDTQYATEGGKSLCLSS